MYANNKMQQVNIFSCANLFLLQAIRCCVPIINRSKIIYCRVLIFPGSHTLLYANRVLYQGNSLSCVYISLRQDIRCCVLIINKVILLSRANIFLLQAIRCCVLIIYCSKVIFYRAPIFPRCKPSPCTSSSRFYASINESCRCFKNLAEKLNQIFDLRPERKRTRWYQLLPNVQAMRC